LLVRFRAEAEQKPMSELLSYRWSAPNWIRLLLVDGRHGRVLQTGEPAAVARAETRFFSGVVEGHSAAVLIGPSVHEGLNERANGHEALAFLDS